MTSAPKQKQKPGATKLVMFDKTSGQTGQREQMSKHLTPLATLFTVSNPSPHHHQHQFGQLHPASSSLVSHRRRIYLHLTGICVVLVHWVEKLGGEYNTN